MRLLGDDSDAQPFEVRGCHSVVYDVELPNMLPKETLEKMI
jgi:hypothetical protein